jgi:hypothetical protein
MLTYFNQLAAFYSPLELSLIVCLMLAVGLWLWRWV